MAHDGSNLRGRSKSEFVHRPPSIAEQLFAISLIGFTAAASGIGISINSQSVRLRGSQCWLGGLGLGLARVAGPTLQHRSVCGVCDGEDVWRHLVSLDAFILFHDLLGVDGQLFVRVDHHAEQAGVCLQIKKRNGTEKQ